jgi:RimJ/RimL family protein N-acetyltransferase
MAEVTLIKSTDNYSLTIDNISVGGAFVGRTTMVPIKEFMSKKTKVIMGFNIKFDNRNKGLGQILMDKINESEKSNGTEYLVLGVETNNEPAIKIYERAGFIKDGPLYNTMHYMWKKL